MAIRTLLFDLDGTLLPIDTDQFIRQYLKALSAHVGHRIPPEVLVEKLMAATEQMIRSTDLSKTNATVFAEHFFPAIEQEEADLLPVFDAFYRERFPSLRSTCPDLPGLGRQVVETAVNKGYEIVLATNPLFPREAIVERMRWVGIEDFPWRHVTTYEEMHAAKPQPAYYQEILTKIDRRPEECMMIGNDVDEDGVAAKVGMRVFFVTDYLINRREREVPADRSGTMAELLAKLESGEL